MRVSLHMMTYNGQQEKRTKKKHLRKKEIMNTDKTKLFKIEVITTCVQRSVQDVFAESEEEAIASIRSDVAANPEKYDNDDVIAYTHHVCNAVSNDYPTV